MFKTLYGVRNKLDNNTIFKYKIGDVVRISKVRGPFTKGYEENYTHEFFTISECIHRQPPVYRLKDYDGDVIQGSFYEQELQKINVPREKTFKVEKILDTKKQGKKTMVLVKWLGWPSKFNSWVPENDVVDIQKP